MQRLTRLFESDAQLTREALAEDGRLLRQMAMQLADLRSEVVREAATCVCAFTTAVGAGSSASASAIAGVALDALTAPLVRLVGAANRVLAGHGQRAAVAMFSTLRSPKLLALLAQHALEDRSAALRARVAELVALCVEVWHGVKLDRNGPQLNTTFDLI